MIDRYTISVFLKHKDKILILKRSKNVATYQGKWALIHGRFEPGEDPEKIAKKEIEEEAGIKNTKLLRTGESFVRIDKIYNIKWHIHPFLFESNSDRIKLNWENTAYLWIKPEELKKYNHELLEEFKRIFGE